MSKLTVTVSGPAGSGKTTLLRFLDQALMNNSFSGEVKVLTNEGGSESAEVTIESPQALAQSVANWPLEKARPYERGSIKQSYTGEGRNFID